MCKAKLAFTIAASILLCGALSASASAAAQSPLKSKGLAAMESAGRDGKYLFILFWKENDQQTAAMNGAFQAAMRKWTSAADSLAIQVADAAEKPLLDKYGLDRAPMPLVLAIAPNGAVTGGFPLKCSEQQLQEAFVSPCSAQCLKCLQDRKLVLICVQNENTQHNQVASKAARDFTADARYAKSSAIVKINPADKAEASLLQDLKVDPQTAAAVTVLLAPPGQPVATFVGPVTKEQIVAKLAAASSGCCPGGNCGPGGCGPKK